MRDTALITHGNVHIGQHADIGPELLELITEIKRRHGPCVEAAGELDQPIRQQLGSAAGA